jgi:hypothetical protein
VRLGSAGAAGGADADAAGTGVAWAGTPTSVRPGDCAGNAVKTCWHFVHWTSEPVGASSDSSSSYVVEQRSQRMTK